MPAVKSKGSAATTRLRKAECGECGYCIRLSRKWIAVGLPSCPCGAGELSVPELEDRCCLPGPEGEAAIEQCWGQADEFGIRSERSRKAMLSRVRCKHEHCGSLVARGELYCSRHRNPMPF